MFARPNRLLRPVLAHRDSVRGFFTLSIGAACESVPPGQTLRAVPRVAAIPPVPLVPRVRAGPKIVVVGHETGRFHSCRPMVAR